MKVILSKTGVVRDVAPDIAELLVAAGLATEPAPPPAPGPRTTWKAGHSQQYGTLIVNAFCSTCGGTVIASGPKATEQLFVHCRTNEKCPRDVAAEYKKLYAQETKKPPRPRSDASAFLRLVGVGTSGETSYHLGDPEA